MPGFRDADELRAVFDALFGLISDDDEIGAALAAARTPQRFVFSDLGEVLDVAANDTPGGYLIWEWGGEPAWAPEVVMMLTSEVANAFWQGKVNPVIAQATGKVRTTGDFKKALRLAPIVRPVFPRYRELLAATGRTHLLL